MSSWKETLKAGFKKALLVPLLAVAMAASVGIYELAKPTSAAAVAEPAPAALDAVAKSTDHIRTVILPKTTS